MGEFEREAQRAGYQNDSLLDRLFSGPLSSCESELQELMRQIDIMMASRKKEWEMEIHSLQARLEIKDKELMSSRMQMETNHKELGQLRHNLQLSETSQQNLTTQYDQQVSKLRNELSGLQKDYERLQKHHSRQSAAAQKTRDDKIEEATKLRADLVEAESHIKEYEEKSKIWEGQRRVYRHQVESLESQRKALAEKNQVFLQQLESYREQLEKTRHVSDQQDRNTKSRLAYCEKELGRAHDKLTERNNRIITLEGSLQNAEKNRMTVVDDNLRLKTELEKSSINIQQLENDVSQLRLELQSRDDLLKASEQENTDQNRDLSQLQESLLLKDNIIRTLKSQNHVQESMELDHHASEMEEKRREVEQLRLNEKDLRKEIIRLQNCLDDTNRECAHLNMELARKIDELSHIEGTELKELNDKCTKLSEKYRSQDGLFHSTVEGMRKEIIELTTDLHERDKTVASLRNNICTLQSKIADADSKSHEGSIELQRENNLLRQHLNTLQQQLVSAENNLKDRLGNQTRESDTAIAEITEEKDRIIETLKIEHRIEIQELKNRLSETINRYEGQIENFQPVEQKSGHSVTETGQTSERVTASTSYIQSPSQRQFFQNPNTTQDLLSFPELISQSDSFQYQRPNSRNSVTSSFVAENKKHTNDLEKLLNHHITDLEKRTDETIGRYIPKSRSDTEL